MYRWVSLHRRVVLSSYHHLVRLKDGVGKRVTGEFSFPREETGEGKIEIGFKTFRQNRVLRKCGRQ